MGGRPVTGTEAHDGAWQRDSWAHVGAGTSSVLLELWNMKP